jgi:site-specific recombinase XerD
MMALTILISVDDFRKLVSKVEAERDRIIIRLLFGTGMRVEELVTTKLEDVETVEGIIQQQFRAKAQLQPHAVLLS